MPLSFGVSVFVLSNNLLSIIVAYHKLFVNSIVLMLALRPVNFYDQGMQRLSEKLGRQVVKIDRAADTIRGSEYPEPLALELEKLLEDIEASLPLTHNGPFMIDREIIQNLITTFYGHLVASETMLELPDWVNVSKEEILSTLEEARKIVLKHRGDHTHAADLAEAILRLVEGEPEPNTIERVRALARTALDECIEPNVARFDYEQLVLDMPEVMPPNTVITARGIRVN